MAPHLRPIGDHPVGRRRRRHPRCLGLGCVVRFVGPQSADRQRHLYLRIRRGCDRRHPRRRMGSVRGVAFSCGLWSRGLVCAGHDHGCRDHADPPSHRRRQPVRHFRHARRISRLIDGRGIAGPHRVAGDRRTRRGAGSDRRRGAVLRTGIGAVADGQRALSGGAGDGCQFVASAALRGSAPERHTQRPAAREPPRALCPAALVLAYPPHRGAGRRQQGTACCCGDRRLSRN
jgi:hypothetical protein